MRQLTSQIFANSASSDEKLRLFAEGIRGEVRFPCGESKFLTLGRDVDLHVPPGPPDQRAEYAALPAIGGEFIVETKDVASLGFVAIAFFIVIVDQSLGVG